MSRRPLLHLGHALRVRMSPADIVRFLSFVKVDDNGCWIWTGSIDEKGYGSFWFSGRRYWATRISYVTFRCPLRFGNDVHHLKRCKSRRCVNPMHLAQRSREWNSRDGARRRHAVTVGAGVYG